MIRTIEGVHEGSILSICVFGGYLASAGSDFQVAMWDLKGDRLVKVIRDHEDSVLCVRFDEKRLVSCSKGGLSHCVLFLLDCLFTDRRDGWYRSDGANVPVPGFDASPRPRRSPSCSKRPVHLLSIHRLSVRRSLHETLGR